ncbi:arylsulfatase [Niabella insulamsoli]|uniref:sulfatase family protein n=1 Tax=Niabella insulamsoli TaxID=3144874 RepID=UPI0031FD259A
MKRITSLNLTLMLMLQAGLCLAQETPNIIFILADDLGYGDVGAFNMNSKIKTPHIDQIAAQGLKLTDAHTSSSVCTPSRYSILTGRYNWRSPLKNGVLKPYDQPLINKERTTLASMLKEKGYQTACIGKWHLGFNWKTTNGAAPVDKKHENNIDYLAPLTGGPMGAGFDYFFGVDAPNYPPYTFIENNRITKLPTEFLTFDAMLDSRPGKGLPDWDQEQIMPRLEAATVSYIQKAAGNKKPFFLYLPLTGPHTPILPTPAFKGRSGLNLYADFVMQADAYVGKVLQTLARENISENTMVIFTSDNGCSPRADFLKLATLGHDPSYIYRGMKSDIFEGGHRVPCVISWPAKIKKGGTITQMVSMVDFFATIAHIVGHDIKDNEGEDSFDFYTLLSKPGSRRAVRDAIVMHSIDGSFSIRKANWKLELCAGSGGWSLPRNQDAKDLPPVQLYDLNNDVAESENLALKYPEKVKQLTALLTKFINEGRSTPGKPQANEGVFNSKQVFFLSQP